MPAGCRPKVDKGFLGFRRRKCLGPGEALLATCTAPPSVESDQVPWSVSHGCGRLFFKIYRPRKAYKLLDWDILAAQCTARHAAGKTGQNGCHLSEKPSSEWGSQFVAVVSTLCPECTHGSAWTVSRETTTVRDEKVKRGQPDENQPGVLE